VCGTPLADTMRLLEELGTKLFRRPADQRPTYLEEQEANRIVNRQDWQAEKGILINFGITVTPEDRRFEFPKTLFKLLSDWDSALDKARTYEPAVDRKASASHAAKVQFNKTMIQ
jgi:hypothetical protein